MSEKINKHITDAMDEATRFLRIAKEYLLSDDLTLYQSKKRAAVKRASMDLSRALVNVRKSEGQLND